MTFDWKKLLVTLVLLDFAALSAYAMFQVGYLGIWRAGLADWGAIQILADLAIACGLILVWLVADARRRGANPWPYVGLTLVGGSIGPLLYLLLRRERGAEGLAAGTV